jgi:hypothetical protein
VKTTVPSKKAATAKKVKAKGQAIGDRRTSGRQRTAVKYVEAGDSTDDDKMDIEDHTSDVEMVV